MVWPFFFGIYANNQCHRLVGPSLVYSYTNPLKEDIMKTLVFVFSILLVATSCEMYYVDPVPVYDPRDQFVGSYDVNEYSSTYDEYWEYGVSIYKSSGDIVIDNFYNSGLRVYANVNGDRL